MAENIRLEKTDKGLALTDGNNFMRGDFIPFIPRIKKAGRKNELLLKACHIKSDKERLTVVDATAGMGEDSLILASAGYNVILFEYDSIISALLKDTIERAEKEPYLCDIVRRMKLFEKDSIKELPNLKGTADVVLLDPMFPARNKSALIKKKFQLIHQIEKPCDNEEQLLDAAISAMPKKIVIKRPLKGDYLAGRKPDYSLKGKAIRYDCFVY